MTLHHSIFVPSIATRERFGIPSIMQRWPRPSPALIHCAEVLCNTLGPIPLAHLLAELQGPDPADRVNSYLRLEPYAKFATEPARGHA